MSIKAGLVGLPNVGKSTLFNALTKSSVPAENYPFCTIDPHLAITEVPDERLTGLATIFKSQKLIPATVSFVDIAGLVKGAASGEGLGNQFLTHIREVDLIIHVLRCFEDSAIIGAEKADPLSDYEIIISELMLKDLESVTKRFERLNHSIKAAKTKPVELKELQAEFDLLKQVEAALESGHSVTVRRLISESSVKTVPLLSAKNFLIVVNVSEKEVEDEQYKHNEGYKQVVERFGIERVVPVCVRLEYELSQLPPAEAEEMMSMIGLKHRALDTIIRLSYQNLGLITFFTCGPKEAHAWPIRAGITVRQAAGEIHSDLEKGFICAEVYNSKDLFAAGSENALKQQGKMRTEGQTYIVQDGDLLNIRFNV